MKSEIKTASCFFTEKDECEVFAPLFYYFGERRKDKVYKHSKIISFFNFDEIPGELKNLVAGWQKKIKDDKYKEGFVFLKKAEIEFGYGDTIYRINPRSLYITCESVFETAAPDILKDLMEAGCDYGEYSGLAD